MLQCDFDEYSDEVMCCPRTSDQWIAVDAVFSSRWNLNHTLGAIDEKYVGIRCPKNSGSLYFNYKGFHLIILFALVDANYNFIALIHPIQWTIANSVGADRPAKRQKKTSCVATGWPVRSTVHSPDGASYFLPV